MSINNLLNNIKKSKYDNIFKSNTLDDKYIAFCEIDKGKYYSTLELTSIKRTRTPDKILTSSNKESFESMIAKLVSVNNYEIYINKIIDILNSDRLSTEDKQIMMIISVYNNIFKDPVNNEDITNLRDISYSSSLDRLVKLCNYFSMSARPYYYKKKLVLNTFVNLLNKELDKDTITNV